MRKVIRDGEAHLTVRYPGSYKGWRGRKRYPNIFNTYLPVDQARAAAEQEIARHRSGEHEVIWLSVRQQDGTTHVWTPRKGWVEK